MQAWPTVTGFVYSLHKFKKNKMIPLQVIKAVYGVELPPAPKTKPKVPPPPAKCVFCTGQGCWYCEPNKEIDREQT